MTYYFGEHFEVENGVIVNYIFAGNLRIAQKKGGVVHYFHKDHLVSSTVMTNESGSKVETTEYMPYGQTRSHWGSTISPYKFTDQEQDADTGLYNYGARLYDPVIGRFITADIIVQDFSDPQTFIGGDIGLGALSGGLSAGMGSYFGNFAPFGSELLGRAIVGGVTGGSVYAMYGESFMEGFGRGAITSTYVYIYNCLLHPACFALGEGVKGDGGGNGPLIVSKRPEGFIITFPYLYRGVFFYYQKQDDGSYNFGLAVPTLENGLIVLPLTGPMKGYDPNDEG
jgi:RHS repeat-associated protein